jgi:hypothetical protein
MVEFIPFHGNHSLVDHRLGQIVVHACFQAFSSISLHGMGGHGNGGRVVIADCGL